jgi:hypothetical protein
MITHYSSYPGYSIKTEEYPFTESKKILETLTNWWEHPSRNTKNIDKISNYHLDQVEENSLGSSMENRLRDGKFSFLYYGDEVIAYSGLLVHDGKGYCHRLATSPFGGHKHRGTGARIIVPYLIKVAHEMGLSHFRLTFNSHRNRQYQMWKNRTWEQSSIDNMRNNPGNEIISRFNFIGEQFIFRQVQSICELDLSRPDITEFFKF